MPSKLYYPIPVDHTKYASSASGDGRLPTSFDAYLYRPLDAGAGQLKLTIKLRLKLRQQSPRLIAHDADDKPFFSSPWSATDWAQFVADAKAQADMWNNKFWLAPSPSFTQFDRIFAHFPGQAYRPYIRCELDVDFSDAKASKTIDVANLNRVIMAAQGRPVGPGEFRSHWMLFDSLDGVPWATPYGKSPNAPKTHHVIAHELGHHLGLHHIGAIRKTPVCVFVQELKAKGIDHLFGPNAQGGRNSLLCYGFGQALDVVDNIMGVGDKFTIDNASPWLWAIGSMRRHPYDMGLWRVLTSDPGDGFWVKVGS